MKKFTRTVENFTCENCGTQVTGNGYTNHCPNCLCSKHVDVNPGDRQANCGGIMEPIAIESTSTSYTITHRCRKCGHTRRNKSAEDDNFDAILEISRQQAKGVKK